MLASLFKKKLEGRGAAALGEKIVYLGRNRKYVLAR